MTAIRKHPLMVSGGWIQAAAIVLMTGFFIMGVLTYYTYNDEPSIPDLVQDPHGEMIFTHNDIMSGQKIFLRNGLMEYGSIFGHGAYLGPDFTAEYLHRAALSSIRFYGGENSDSARIRTIQDNKTNCYDPQTGVLVFTPAQTFAFREGRAYYASFFGEPTTRFGLRPKAIRDLEEIRQLTAFFSWTAWAASTARPGHSYSYTNNWPAEPLVDNHATADAVVWSVLSLIALLGGLGLLLGVFGRWNLLGLAWAGAASHDLPRPGRGPAYSRSERWCMVLLCHGRTLCHPNTSRKRNRALPGGPANVLRHRPGAHSSVQYRPHVAPATLNLLGVYLLPRVGHLSRPDDRRPRAAWTKDASSWPARGAFHRGGW